MNGRSERRYTCGGGERHEEHGVVERGVEFGARRGLDALEAVLREHALQDRVGAAQALEQVLVRLERLLRRALHPFRLRLGLLRLGARKRDAQRVGELEQVLAEALHRELLRRLHLALQTPPHVLRLSQRAHVLILRQIWCYLV